MIVPAIVLSHQFPTAEPAASTMPSQQRPEGSTLRTYEMVCLCLTGRDDEEELQAHTAKLKPHV